MEVRERGADRVLRHAGATDRWLARRGADRTQYVGLILADVESSASRADGEASQNTRTNLLAQFQGTRTPPKIETKVSIRAGRGAADFALFCRYAFYNGCASFGRVTADSPRQ